MSFFFYSLVRSSYKVILISLTHSITKLSKLIITRMKLWHFNSKFRLLRPSDEKMRRSQIVIFDKNGQHKLTFLLFVIVDSSLIVLSPSDDS